ncbi:SEC-C metal-binding domain-containing protein [Paracoccus endophyticus]|uniref:SEC-C metal-binding domain-containing protein n=1 Tax=Paracoccus endophyticus TaxID=2233774 RepID=UPI001F0C6B13|nr:SEC-C metal-binding domain-containing protein [Paracoccus endophyticus]
MTIPDALFSEVQQAVDRHQPELTASRTDNLIILEGLFVVSGPDGPFDSYQIKAGITAGFPAEEPVVFEEGGRIPRIADRHVFPKDGNCCLGVWEEWLLRAPDHRFETFFTGLMHDYFVSQTYYEVNGVWPFGERSHGMLGVLEAYADLLGIALDAKIISDHLLLLSRQQIKGHALCPCGSGRRLRQCHSDDFQRLTRQIPPFIAKRMYSTISPKKLS